MRPHVRDGTRTFDFNTDGMAHIGMYPDFFADLQRVGLSSRQLEPVFRSAERYIELWSAVNGVTGATQQAGIAPRR